MAGKIVAIDLGYGYVKDTSDGKTVIVRQAVVGTGRDLTQTPFAQERNSEDSVRYDGKLWFVGEKAVRQSDMVYQSLDDSKVTDTTNRVLFYAAMQHHLPRNVASEVSIVVGLPVAHRKKWEEPLTEMLLGRHVFGAHDVTVQKVKVVDQPVGTYLDGLLADDGTIANPQLFAMKVAVVDIGYRTTDVMAFHKAESLERLSGSVNVAMSDAYEHIAEALRNTHGIIPSLWQIEECVRAGSIVLKGKRHDITDIINRAYERTALAITYEVDALWRKQWTIDAILLTGGGGVALSQFINWPTTIVVPNAQVANVIGYYKLGKMLLSEKE